MSGVKARGKKGGKFLLADVIVDNGYDYFVSDTSYETELGIILNGTVFVGGTYPAPDGSLLKAYYALERFFDEVQDINVDGEIEEIPYEPGVMY